jgi:type I restriction-modification system DNA methylase subunit
LLTDHVYEDGTGKHTVALAGFARPVYDSRTSCISVVRSDELLEVTSEYVNQFRGFGAPVVFVPRQDNLQWWTVGTSGAGHKATIPGEKISNFFVQHKADFAPDKIWRAKNLGRVDTRQQLGFVDIGLMPLLEKEMGERLGELMKRAIGLLRNGFTENQLKERDTQRWIFQAGFWVLCAKILQDKRVKNFIRLDITDVGAVIEAVRAHYGAQEGIAVASERQKKALEATAAEVGKFASLSNLTTEAFGYMYENVLVDKKLRSALGIHATPSYLVDYIVWQLWPWIEQIPEDKRIVLEPACGHAPFLTGAMRLLRELFKGDEKAFHEYAKKQLIGIETDSFALEIARLSLTMADVPNPNGWNIVNSDIYQADVLKRASRKATILFCNPPFENFTKSEKQKYGNAISTGNKASEVLAQTLPCMPDNSVFGIILPQGFLNKKNLAGLRKLILDNYELRTICNLPDNVFAKAGHPSTILLGRKSRREAKTIYLEIHKDNLENFKNTYQAYGEIVNKEIFYQTRDYSFRIPELKEIWDYCRCLSKFREYAKIGRGIEYKDFDKSVKKEKFRGAVKGYASFEKFTKDKEHRKVDVNITELPDHYWMSLNESEIQNLRYGAQCGVPQVITSYIRSSRGVWRIEGLLDLAGDPVSNKLISIRPVPTKGALLSLYVIWALVNSPLTNAYMFCHCRRQNLEGVLRGMPVPFEHQDLSKLENMARNYFELEKNDEFRLKDEISFKEKKKQCLLAIDAEILRLYDLPPRLEKQLLDFFAGTQRKGVDFKFEGYYPEGFESAIPLHEYLSEEYQRSTVAFVDEWVKKHRSPEINEVLRKAVDAFEEE